MQSLWARVDLGVMPMWGYSAFPKVLALLEPHHRIVYRHIRDNPCEGIITPCRIAVGVFYCPSWMGLVKKESSSSCRAGSTGIPDRLSPLLPNVHRSRQVLWTTSRILTQLLNVCSCWSSLLLHSHMWGSLRVHLLWVRPCFSSSVLHVWFV